MHTLESPMIELQPRQVLWPRHGSERGRCVNAKREASRNVRARGYMVTSMRNLGVLARVRGAAHIDGAAT